MGHLVFGLTGNLGSGKSTVASMLRKLGARTIDSDTTVRCLLDEDSALRTDIKHEFGAGALSGAQVDRRALAKIVFSDVSALERLERLIHPRVGRITTALLEEPTDAFATFIEAIKVVEGPSGDQLDGLWVVTAADAMMIDRVVTTGHFTEQDARSRLAIQSSVTAKISAFQVRRPGRPVWKLVNDGSLTQLKARVAAVWAEVLSYASNRESCDSPQ